MSEAVEECRAIAEESSEDFDELRTTAKEMVRGLNLLRWAMIMVFASGLLIFTGKMLIGAFFSYGYIRSILPWSLLALEVSYWIIAPLALSGIVRIIRIRDWTVHRLLVIVLIIYFAAQCVWTPLMSVYSAVTWFFYDGSLMSIIDVITPIIGMLLSLVYFVMLFAGYNLAGVVDDYFGNSLISRNHRRWLLRAGVLLYCVEIIWWVVWFFCDLPMFLHDMGADDYMYEYIIGGFQLLLTGIPGFLWLIWLLVVMFRIGMKLKRFANLNHCPNCDYDLRVHVEAGCPECGWMREVKV